MFQEKTEHLQMQFVINNGENDGPNKKVRPLSKHILDESNDSASSGISEPDPIIDEIQRLCQRRQKIHGKNPEFDELNNGLI